MYKSLFHLERHPFELSPDPEFLLPTEPHNEALALMYHGIRRHKGIVVVTGEVGTGKTLLLHCLLRELRDSKDVATVYLASTLLTPAEFLRYVLADLGYPSFHKDKGELLFDLSRILIARGQQGLTTVVIVDEAHNLGAELLEEIRMLTNLETPEMKLLQVMLVGQPELDAKLDEPQFRALKQRVSLRGSLRMLNEEETHRFIEHRLRLAGLATSPSGLFPKPTVERVFSYSGGTPRLINAICENSLLLAYSAHSRTVTPEMVDEAAQDLRLPCSATGTDFGAKDDSAPAMAVAGQSVPPRREVGPTLKVEDALPVVAGGERRVDERWIAPACELPKFLTQPYVPSRIKLGVCAVGVVMALLLLIKVTT